MIPAPAIAPLAASLLVVAVGCGGSTQPNTIVGSYVATTFTVVAPGIPEENVLAMGGSLTIAIAPDNSATGLLFVPASANAGTAITSSMAGVAKQSESTVTFTPTAFSFIESLRFTIVGRTLQAVNQESGSGFATITLTRQ